MTDETTAGVTVGDRVTFIDTNGDEQRAICSHVHGPTTIDVVHRAGGEFGEFAAGEFVEKTSVPEAQEPGETYSHVEGGWSA